MNSKELRHFSFSFRVLYIQVSMLSFTLHTRYTEANNVLQFQLEIFVCLGSGIP